jgi:hypothetical protein
VKYLKRVFAVLVIDLLKGGGVSVNQYRRVVSLSHGVP